MPRPRFFRSAAAFRRWLERHHKTLGEVWVGFYRKGSGKKGITYQEALDEALCFGWVPGSRRAAGEGRSSRKFAPRRAKSRWTARHLARALVLARSGLMRPAGFLALGAREREAMAAVPARLGPRFSSRFRASPAAWAFFRAQSDGYRRKALWWVMTARDEASQMRRLTLLIEDSGKKLRLRFIRAGGSRRGGTRTN